MQLTAQIERGQWFAVALSDDIDNGNQVIFQSKSGSGSDAVDATGQGAGKSPRIDTIQGLAATKFDTSNTDYVETLTFRKLQTADEDDVVLKLNKLYKVKWAENVNSADALETRTSEGNCEFELKGDKCPAGKESDRNDRSRIIDCSSTDKCWNS